MSEILVFDTEDNSQELVKKEGHSFGKKVTEICCVSETGDSFYNRGDVEQYTKWMLSRKKPKQPSNYYAHNLGYDLGIWRRELPIVDVDMIGGRILEARVHGLRFFDSSNIWKSSVKKLGEAFGLAKLKMGEKGYVKRDCEIPLKALLHARKLLNGYGVERLPKTLGGIAVRIFEAMGGEIPFCSDEVLKEGYYGGRTEIFRKGPVEGCCYEDINSQYPFVMLDSFPDDTMVLPNGKALDCHGMVWADVEVNKGARIGPLPYRTENGIVYPVGKFSGAWTVEEISHPAVKIHKVHKVIGSMNAVRYYAEFVNHLYQKRLECTDEPSKMFYKLVLNNLYGRLGMSGMMTRTMDVTNDDFCGEDYVGDGRVYGDKKLVDLKMPLPRTLNFLHAAMVTSKARILLRKRLEQLGESVVYCDTDSVIYQGRAGKGSTELGEWKVVARNVGVECWLPKMYRMGKEFKAKGVRANLAEQFCRTGSVEYERPYKFRESVVLWERKNLAALAVWRKTTKEMRANYAEKKKLTGNAWLPMLVP